MRNLIIFIHKNRFVTLTGSVVVEFDVAGSADDVSDFISELYSLVSAGLTVTFDGTDFTTLDELYVDNEVCRQSCLRTCT